DRPDVDAACGKELREKDSVLVGRTAQFRRHAPGLLQFVVREASEFGLGIADVDRQEHRIGSSSASSNRAASVFLSERPSSRRPSSPHKSTNSLSPVPNPRSPLTSLTAIASRCLSRSFLRACV